MFMLMAASSIEVDNKMLSTLRTGNRLWLLRRFLPISSPSPLDIDCGHRPHEAIHARADYIGDKTCRHKSRVKLSQRESGQVYGRDGQPQGMIPYNSLLAHKDIPPLRC